MCYTICTILLFDKYIYMGGVRMNKGMRNIINNLTQDIISLFDIQIPITNMIDVVTKLGGIVIESDEIGLYSDGYIEKNLSKSIQSDYNFTIVIPSNQSDNRQNFTIAHELGHLFLHMGYYIDEELWLSDNNMSFNRMGHSETELQANEFAAALLMPKKEYKKILDKNTVGNTAYTSKIAEYFHVSVDAASNRGKWLGYLAW